MVGNLVGCCERAASGQVATALPRSVMNSRRLMGFPRQRISHPSTFAGRCGVVRHSKISTPMSALGQKRTLQSVRIMSALPPKADIVGSGRERSCGANKADGSDPAFGYVTDLIACHCRKIITEEEPPCDRR